MAIGVAISFDSGILLYADAKYREPRRIPIQITKMLSTACGGNDRGRSIFLVPEPNDRTAEAVHYAEEMLRLIEPANCTIDRMRATIESSWLKVSEGKPRSEPMQECA